MSVNEKSWVELLMDQEMWTSVVMCLETELKAMQIILLPVSLLIVHCIIGRSNNATKTSFRLDGTERENAWFGAKDSVHIKQSSVLKSWLNVMFYCFDSLTFCIADFYVYKTRFFFLIYPLQKMRDVAVAL